MDVCVLACPAICMGTLVNGDYIAMTVGMAIVLLADVSLELCGRCYCYLCFLYVWQMERPLW